MKSGSEADGTWWNSSTRVEQNTQSAGDELVPAILKTARLRSEEITVSADNDPTAVTRHFNFGIRDWLDYDVGYRYERQTTEITSDTKPMCAGSILAPEGRTTIFSANFTVSGNSRAAWGKRSR